MVSDKNPTVTTNKLYYSHTFTPQNTNAMQRAKILHIPEKRSISSNEKQKVESRDRAPFADFL